MSFIYQSVRLDLEGLICALTDQLSEEGLISFIKRLDAEAHSWSVTLPLCQHFAKLKKINEQEQKEEKKGKKNG